MLWCLDNQLCCLRKVLIGKINRSIWFCCIKKKKSLMKDKRSNKAQRPHTCQNPKRHISLVSLLVVLQNCGCMMLLLVSRLANVVRQLVRQLDKILEFLLFLKSSISSHLKMFSCFKYNMQCNMDQQYSVKVILLHKLSLEFLVAVLQSPRSLLKQYYYTV